MKRMAAVLLIACCGLPLWAQNANRPVDDTIDSPLEYYFGAMAMLAIVMTWLWLWLKTRRSLQPAETENQP